jgi:hypothetical protein
MVSESHLYEVYVLALNNNSKEVDLTKYLRQMLINIDKILTTLRPKIRPKEPPISAIIALKV